MTSATSPRVRAPTSQSSTCARPRSRGGAVHDPVGALLLCAPAPAAFTIVDGKVRVREGRLASFELEPLLERHDALSRKLVLG